MVTLAEIHAAAARIAGAIVRTPLVLLPQTESPFEIYLKDESAQPIHSFKLRGAYNKIAQFSPDQLRRGVIAYSSGNHAQGVAWAARKLGAKAIIVMPGTMPQIKLDATRALGAEVILVGPSSSERREKAETLAAEHGYSIVPPYDDPQIIAGAATCGLEIIEQLPTVNLVVAPVGGGGLIGGVATAIKLTNPRIAVWGAEPALAADAKASFDARSIVEISADDTARTIADGLRTQSLGHLNLQHILAHVDGFVSVTEDEILNAMRLVLTATRIVPEPSGAVALAAALYHADELPPAKQVAVIVSGGNLDPTLRKSLSA